MFGPVQTFTDVLGHVRMNSEAFGSVLTLLEISKDFEKSIEMVFRNFGKVLMELDTNGPQNQLLHKI